jgi:hypothetical protein
MILHPCPKKETNASQSPSQDASCSLITSHNTHPASREVSRAISHNHNVVTDRHPPFIQTFAVFAAALGIHSSISSSPSSSTSSSPAFSISNACAIATSLAVRDPAPKPVSEVAGKKVWSHTRKTLRMDFLRLSNPSIRSCR